MGGSEGKNPGCRCASPQTCARYNWEARIFPLGQRGKVDDTRYMDKTSIYEIRAAGKVSRVVGAHEMAETVKALQDHGWAVKVRKVR